MSTEFSRTLSLLRKERGVSQRMAATDLGVSQALLSHYENGIREPGLAVVVKACDYYHVSADYMLGRTLARDGSMLTPEEILDMAEPGNVLQGSVLATLRGKLLTSACGVLFGLLGKLGDKSAINAAADSLGCQIYLLYRQLHRAAGGSPEYFALPEEDCAAGTAWPRRTMPGPSGAWPGKRLSSPTCPMRPSTMPIPVGVRALSRCSARRTAS